MTLKLYRPNPDGGLEPAPEEAQDYRHRLRSRRWGAARLENPESGTTNPWLAALFIALLCFLTLLGLVLGFASGFWH